VTGTDPTRLSFLEIDADLNMRDLAHEDLNPEDHKEVPIRKVCSKMFIGKDDGQLHHVTAVLRGREDFSVRNK